MKRILILLLLFQACTWSGKKQQTVQVTISPNPAKLNEVAIVKMSVEHKDGILPDFYIVHKRDTGLLNYNPEKDCAILELVNNKVGKYSYQGFVNFIDVNSVAQTAEYTINFEVEE